MENTASFKHRFQDEWRQIMPCQHFYSSYISAVDFLHAFSRNKDSSPLAFCEFWTCWRQEAVYDFLCNVMLLNATSMKSLHLEQLVFCISFGFSFYLSYHQFFCWSEGRYQHCQWSIFTRVYFCGVPNLVSYDAAEVCSSKSSPVVKAAEEKPVIKLPAVSGFAACLDGSAVCPSVLWTGDCKHCADTVATGGGGCSSAHHPRQHATVWVLTEHYVNLQSQHKSSFSG